MILSAMLAAIAVPALADGVTLVEALVAQILLGCNVAHVLVR